MLFSTFFRAMLRQCGSRFFRLSCGKHRSVQTRSLLPSGRILKSITSKCFAMDSREVSRSIASSATNSQSQRQRKAKASQGQQQQQPQKRSEPPKSRRGAGVENQVVLSMSGITKVIPGNRQLLKDASMSFWQGAKIGVLGLNGSGKSTLLKILGGVDKDYDGEVTLKTGLRVGYLHQEPPMRQGSTVKEAIFEGLREQLDLIDRFNDLSNRMGEPDADFDKLIEEQAEVQGLIEAADGWNLEHLVGIAKRGLNVPPDDALVDSLSGGERRRVALCRLLVEKPDLLLLDEPTNHLDAESVHWLERFLESYPGTVLAVTHDRYFLDSVAGWILEVDRGNLYPYAGNYRVWLERKQERLNSEARADKAAKRELDEELQWIRAGTNGRQRKSGARIKAFEGKQDDLLAKQQAQRFKTGRIAIPPGPRLGHDVVQVENLTISVPKDRPTGGDGREGIDTEDDGSGERRILVEEATFTIPRGALVAVVGPNGAGKSTLMQTLLGLRKPDSGKLVLGKTVQHAYADQGRNLEEGQTVIQAVAQNQENVAVGDLTVHTQHYLAKFSLSGAMSKKMVRDLSGGERSRVHLARTLLKPCNVLVLDEPTNDLDVETLRSLEEALEQYQGSALVVSHDRYFLDRVCTHVLSFEGNGKLRWFEGSFSDWEQRYGAKTKLATS